MAQARCRALLFDLDGVLVDSTECVTRTWQRWADAHGLRVDQILAVAHGRRTIDTVRLVAPHLAADAEVAALAATEEHETDGVYEVPGARDLLHALPRNTWAVITAGVKPVASLRISHTGLPEPEVLVTAEDLERGKPDPEGFLMAAGRLGASPRDCIVVEDSPAGLEAAHRAGMQAIAMATTHASEQLQQGTWGVRALTQLRVSPHAAGLDVEVERPLWGPG